MDHTHNILYHRRHQHYRRCHHNYHNHRYSVLLVLSLVSIFGIQNVCSETVSNYADSTPSMKNDNANTNSDHTTSTSIDFYTTITNTTKCNNAVNNTTVWVSSNVNAKETLPDNLEAVLTIPCGMTTYALIADRMGFQRYVKTFPIFSGLPFIQYNQGGYSAITNPSQLDPFLRTSYVGYRHEYFVVVTDNPGHVVNQMEYAFLEDTHGELALLPHKTKWIIIIWTERQWEEVAMQLYRSVFDNIAVVKMKRKTDPFLGYEIHDVATFMWRQHRTRKLSKVDLNFFDSNYCDLFPNINYGMNGRKLVVGPKVFYKSFLHVTKSGVNGTEKFEGLLIDVLDITSKRLNYTYVLNTAFNKITWSEYRECLRNGSMDIGLSVWSTFFSLKYNMSSSYPVAFDAIVGIYRRSDGAIFPQSWRLVCPFPPIFYLFLLACSAYMSFLYVMLAGYWKFYNSKHQKQTIDHSDSSSRFEKSRSVVDECDDKEIKTRLSVSAKIINVMVDYVDTFTLFCVTSLNQSYLPRPHQVSARLVVGFWALGCVCLTAIFSSAITAIMVKPKRDVPFKTLHGLMMRKDYTITMFEGAVFDYTMDLAKEGSLFAALKRKATPISLRDESGEPIDDNLGEYLENLKTHTVFFHYESFIKSWLSKHGNADDYVIMDNDQIFKADITIIFAKHSQLPELVSAVIRRLYDSGIHTRMLQEHISYLGVHGRRLEPIRDKDETTGISHLTSLILICLMCLLFSVVVLGLEMMRARWSDIVSVLRMLLPVNRFRQSYPSGNTGPGA